MQACLHDGHILGNARAERIRLFMLVQGSSNQLSSILDKAKKQLRTRIRTFPNNQLLRFIK